MGPTRLARRVFVAFILTFAIARSIVILMAIGIMRDFYLRFGQTHVHHLNYGIFILSGVGAFLIFLRPDDRGLARAAALYGVGLTGRDVASPRRCLLAARELRRDGSDCGHSRAHHRSPDRPAVPPASLGLDVCSYGGDCIFRNATHAAVPENSPKARAVSSERRSCPCGGVVDSGFRSRPARSAPGRPQPTNQQIAREGGRRRRGESDQERSRADPFHGAHARAEAHARERNEDQEP